MNFSDRVLTITMAAPEGWAQELTLDEYPTLPAERRKYYSPLFAKYRQVKRREYDEYGHFIGWEPHPVGVGDPVGYKYIGVFAAKTLDSLLSTNVLMNRILANNRTYK
jgi:hypothetical protein